MRAARDLGDDEIRKLTLLRRDLEEADAEIDRGDCSEHESESLDDLFQEVEAEAMARLADKSSGC